MILLKEVFEKVDFEKISADDKKLAKLPSRQRVHEPTHAILVLIVHASSYLYAPPSSGARDLIIGRMLHLFPQFRHTSSEGYDETVGVHRIARL